MRSHTAATAATAATAPSKDGVQAVLDASVGRSRFPCGHRETVELHFGESNLTDKAMAKLMVTRTCEAVACPMSKVVLARSAGAPGPWLIRFAPSTY